eukprot:Skav211705  [mRNA]  locus=scaffold4901:23302:24369:+ [translate_table: standard]
MLQSSAQKQPADARWTDHDVERWIDAALAAPPGRRWKKNAPANASVNASPDASASANAIANESTNACMLDSQSMWGARLQKSPILGSLKDAFEGLSESVFAAIKEKEGGCEHVTITASLFSQFPIQGRPAPENDDDMNAPEKKYTGEPGCGFYIMSDWQAQLPNAALLTQGGWHLIPFPTDQLLRTIPDESKSNELQRFFNLVKIAAPLYLPEETQEVTFGDLKCDLNRWGELVSGDDFASDANNILTLHHTRAGEPLSTEFEATISHMAERSELPPVFSDIERLQNYLGPNMLTRNVDLAEVQCMTWHVSGAIKPFSRRWFWYTSTFSMRSQLTWNPALFDCGQELKVKYIWPH